MALEEIREVNSVFYSNNSIDTTQLMNVDPGSVLVVSRIMRRLDRAVQAAFTNVAAQYNNGRTVTFFCTDNLTGKAFFGTYSHDTKQFFLQEDGALARVVPQGSYRAGYCRPGTSPTTYKSIAFPLFSCYNLK